MVTQLALRATRSSVFAVVQLLSRVQLFATPWTTARQASLSFANSRSLLRFMSVESVMLSSHLTLCCSLLLLPSLFPSIRVFSSESALLMGWPKYQSFSWTFFYRNQLISSFTLKCSDEIRECLYFCGECVLDLPCVKWTEVKWRALRQRKAVWKPCSHPGMREMGGNSNHCGPPSQAGHSDHTGETPPGKRRVGRSRIWAINHRIEEYQG